MGVSKENKKKIEKWKVSRGNANTDMSMKATQATMAIEILADVLPDVINKSAFYQGAERERMKRISVLATQQTTYNNFVKLQTGEHKRTGEEQELQLMAVEAMTNLASLVTVASPSEVAVTVKIMNYVMAHGYKILDIDLIIKEINDEHKRRYPHHRFFQEGYDPATDTIVNAQGEKIPETPGLDNSGNE